MNSGASWPSGVSEVLFSHLPWRVEIVVVGGY